MSKPSHPADSRPSVKLYAGSSNAIFISIKEGFICAGIWAILAAGFASGIRLWGEYAYPQTGIISITEWAELIGGIIGQFVLMTICLSTVSLLRRLKNVSSFILLDWRWWLGLVFLSVLLKNPPLAWLWVGLVYQVRLSVKPKPPPSTTIAA